VVITKLGGVLREALRGFEGVFEGGFEGGFDNCKQVFSEVGDFLKPHHSRLQPNIIAALQCNCSYKSMRFKRSSINGK